jgi:hypothetical protein
MKILKWMLSKYKAALMRRPLSSLCPVVGCFKSGDKMVYPIKGRKLLEELKAMAKPVLCDVGQCACDVTLLTGLYWRVIIFI